jgi:bifunctional non-homologous end joining protein LigD
VADRLAPYRAKRDLAVTPEPAGTRFVVQEHSARRLHWDLRLERDGVAVSWAVPKGIPLRPEDNRLAVHTEDHPLEYLSWEGEIPKGEYGGGTMRVWDAGSYETEKWREDEVIVVFHGERVSGRYVLFRTRGQDWMIHRMDPPAPDAGEPLPEQMTPMLARTAELPTDDGRWAYEVKWDGVRVLCWVDGGAVRLQSRNGRDVTSQYPEVGALGRALGARPALLDGEIAAFDDAGRPSFERLQGRMHLGSPAAVRRKMRDTPATLVVFDVLHLDGDSLLRRPWTERRAALEALGLDGPAWRTPAAHRGDGREFAAATRAQGLEGVIAKRIDSPYEPGRRSGCWVKVKHVNRQEVVIGGWLPGDGKRRGTIGALVIGVHDEDGRLRYAGRVGTGFGQAELLRLEKLLGPLERETSPFEAGKPPKGVQWVEPELIAEIELSEWTGAGIARQPSYKGLRDDLDPNAVVREGDEPDVEPEPEPRPASRRAAPTGGEVEVGGRRLKLSNLDKVLYPEAGFAKAQVLDYYIRIAPVLLPHLRGRPLTRKRYPDGVEGESFFEKNAPAHKPDWVTTTRQGKTNFVVADDLPTLVWLANLAALELHLSLSCAASPEHPTLLVFDLDPGEPADIVDCCQVGVWIRELLAELGLESFPKTSGSKGLQVYVPLNRGEANYEDTKPFARAVAELLERRHPDRVVSRMSKALRPGKVLVDWSQNDRHKTTIGVYSLRARPRPTVSTPTTWGEVEATLEAEDATRLRFEAGDVLERVAECGDLFAPTLELGRALPALGA